MITKINDYNFFDLLGLPDLPKKEKDMFENQLNELVWKEFLVKDLNTLLEIQDIHTINKMVKENKNPKELIDYIVKKVPNLKDHLTELTAKVKIIILRKQFSNILENLEKVFYSISNEKEKVILRKKIDHFIKAVDLLDNSDWVSLKNHMIKKYLN